MPSSPGASFRARLATVDHETATAFVAAVFAARGWTVDHRGDDLRATPPGADRPRRLVVDIGVGEHAHAEADTNAADGADPIRVDAATLHELVVYALSTAERTRLCREFLDSEFGAFDAPPTVDRVDVGTGRNARDSDSRGTADTWRERGGGAPASDSTDDARSRDEVPEHDGDGESSASGDARTMTRRERRVRVGVAVVALSLVLGGIVTAVGPGLTGSAAAILDGGVTADDGGGGQADEVQLAANGSWPPGLDGSGVGNARRLADAHEAALDGRPFRLRIVFREFDDDGMRGVAHERAVVAASGRYRSEVRRIGTIDHGSSVIGAAETYSDGERRYVRSADGDGDAAGESPTLRPYSTMATTDPNRLVDRTERYVRWYLGVNESRLTGTVDRDGTTLYAIDFEGDPWPAATDASGRALVSETGVVREIRRTYVPRSDRSVRIEIVVQITPEPVAVTRPDWVPTDEPGHGTDPRPPRNASAVDGRAEAVRAGARRDVTTV
ncbi:hypothetical protein [Haloplanus natans]|uniref:hypothetical protein n=1 Tax=Haloplanus natans TaxID=376171 RepID=UPI000677C6FE|nr:hypothetical protein [Haloplanus natans]